VPLPQTVGSAAADDEQACLSFDFDSVQQVRSRGLQQAALFTRHGMPSWPAHHLQASSWILAFS
jgi:hypothetical protein